MRERSFKMNNYSEQIFQSIDTIISQRLNEVKFDRTITCEVIAGVKDYPNKYRYGFEIVGQSENILKYFKDFFYKNNIKTNIYYRSTNNTKRLMTGSKSEILKIINLLYYDCNLYIERKYPSQILQLAA